MPRKYAEGANVRRFVILASISGLLLAAGCGGSSKSSTTTTTTGSTTSIAGGNVIVTSGNNVAPLIVDSGPVPSNPQVNVAFTTVMVCAPGTANCVTIDHIAVDTGSTGLRIPASLLSTLNLPNVNPSAPVAECQQFLDNSFFFGSVRMADVKMGGASNTGEVASSVPIHVMGDSSITAPVAGSCSTVTTVGGTTITGTEEDSVTALGANGLLGVGNFQFDCDVLGNGNPCTSAVNPPPAEYYTCSSSVCNVASALTTQQVRNPVSMFASDNNGVIVELPAVPVGGQANIASGLGSMVFGIGTQSNNGLTGSAVVLTLDPVFADAAFEGVTTVFNGVSFPHSTNSFGSFLDSGSNGIFFLDQPTSTIPSCTVSVGFYCPTTTETLVAVNQATGGNSRGIQFSVSNANTLFVNNGGLNTAFSDLSGPNTAGIPNAATQAGDGFFDWGLPFFYGRNVYVAISQVAPPGTPVSGSSVPAGPFWAY